MHSHHEQIARMIFRKLRGKIQNRHKNLAQCVQEAESLATKTENSSWAIPVRARIIELLKNDSHCNRISQIDNKERKILHEDYYGS